MEIYEKTPQAAQEEVFKVEMNQPTHMEEEEPESIDVGDLHIIAMEMACKNKEYDKIPPRQVESLEVVLFRAQ